MGQGGRGIGRVSRRERAWQFLYSEVGRAGDIEQRLQNGGGKVWGSLEQECSRKREQVLPEADDACFRNSKRVSVDGKGE